MSENARLARINTALNALSALATSPNLRVVAVATTGLRGVPIEIVVLGVSGELLYHEFIAADRPIEADASRINGVEDGDLAGALTARAVVADPEQTLLAPDCEIVAYSPQFIYEAFTRAGADIDARQMWENGQALLSTQVGAWNAARQDFSFVSLAAAVRETGVSDGDLVSLGTTLGNAQRLQRLIHWHGTAPRTGVLENLDGFCAGCGQPEQHCACDAAAGA